MKKDYIKPAVNVVRINTQAHLLINSGKTKGLVTTES